MTNHTPKRGSAGLRLFREGGIYTAGLFLLRAGNFLLIPLYTSLLTTEEYGAVGVIMAVANLLTIVGMTSQTHALLRLGTDVEGSPEQLRQLLSTQFTWVMSATLALTIVAALGWPWILPLVGGLSLWPLGVAGLATVVGSATFQLILSWLQFSRQARAHTVLSVARWLVLMVVVLSLLLGAQWKAEALLTATAVSFAVGSFLGWRTLPEGVRIGVLDRRLLREALAYGLPILPHGLAGVIFLATDRTLLAAYHGLGAVGIYELAAKLASVVFMIAMGMQKAWIPFFFREDKEAAQHGWKRVRVLSFFAVSMVSCVAVGIGLLAPELVAIAGTDAYADAAEVVPILAGANFMRDYYLVVVAVVMADKATARWVAAATLPAAGLNIVLNAWWIPEHGVFGAAWGTAVSFGVSVVLAGLLARRARTIPFKYMHALVLFALVCVTLWAGTGASLPVRLGLGVLFAGGLLALDGKDLWKAAKVVRKK